MPLPAGTTSQEYRLTIERLWFDKLKAFKPELLFFSAGTEITMESCQGKIISVLEGGYNLQVLANSVIAHLEGIL